MYIIIVYDIAKNENSSKRYRHIYSLCKQYLNHVQNSVFEGNITPSNYYQFITEIKKHIDPNVDSFTIFKHPSEKWLDKELVGKSDNNQLSNIF